MTLSSQTIDMVRSWWSDI